MHETNEFGQPILPQINWQVPVRPNNTLSGHYCTLVPLDVHQHADELFAALQMDNLGESWTYLPYGPFNKAADFRDCLIHKIGQEHDTFMYAILDNKTQKPVGHCGYLRITPQQGCIEIGHVHFSKLLQKTAAATEAIYLMLKNAFTLGYRRCEWKCHSLNEASKRAALRFGFTFEGIFRQHMVIRNRNRDTAWFSLLDHEWQDKCEKFERWLSPQNFDAQGQQRMRLT